MVSKDWTEQEKELLIELRPRHTIAEIAQTFKRKGLKRSRKAIERKAANLGLSYKGKTKEAEVETKNEKEYLEAWGKITEITKEYKDELREGTRGVIAPEKKRRKILTISDFHIPFDRDDLVHEAVENHSDADVLVVNGDMLDLHAVSTWPKDKSIALRKEYEKGIEYMKIFSKQFPHVILTRGNHEFRLNRYFHSNVNPVVSFLVNKEILGRLAAGEIYDEDGNIKEKHDFSNVTYDSGPEAWFFQVGKTIFAHPQTFSRVEGRTSVQAWEYFMEREDIDSVVIAHTHQQSKIVTRGKLCIEQGCMCVPLDYSKQGKLRYKPQSCGYAVIYQDEDGNTDFNESRCVFRGVQYPIKKSFDELTTQE
ncbi:MAG: metallophosphoesterase [Candidatus Bathyarchaeota archaeon]|jgi:predicted phosphodiesterase|nr:metallophosphoesterase [Candidatus Bathyarchaeota archaeon]